MQLLCNAWPTQRPRVQKPLLPNFKPRDPKSLTQLPEPALPYQHGAFNTESSTSLPKPNDGSAYEPYVFILLL